MFEPRTDGRGHPGGWPARMHVCGLYEARRLGLASGVSHLLSIHGLRSRLFTIDGLAAERHLVLTFDDTLDAMDTGAAEAGHVGAVCRWIDGLPGDARLIVHCLQGLNRSTAVALGILSRYLPARMAAAALHAIRPMANPNRLIVAQWDEALGLGGDLNAAAAGFPCRVWQASAA